MPVYATLEKRLAPALSIDDIIYYMHIIYKNRDMFVVYTVHRSVCYCNARWKNRNKSVYLHRYHKIVSIVGIYNLQSVKLFEPARRANILMFGKYYISSKCVQ